MTTPALPPGFVLEDDDTPPLPPGFVMVEAPDFSSVTSGSATEQGQRQRINAGGSQRFGSRVVRNLGGERLEEGFIGLGRSMDRTIRGVKQAATDSVRNQGGALALALRSAGLDSASDAVARNVAAPAARSSQAQMREEAGLRSLDAQFDPGGYVTSGDVAGTIGQVLGPGALLRGTAAAPALLPRTLAGNALQGGVIGALQPVAKEGERGLNSLVGTAAGFGGAALPRVIGSGVSGLRRLLPGAVSTTDRAAGRAILSEASNPNMLSIASSGVPGVQRTLGEATLDSGLMALENTIRSPNSALFTNIDRANNAARINLLQGIAGTDADLIAANEARQAASSGLRDRAFAEGAQSAAQSQQDRALMMGGGSGMARLQREVSAISNAKGGNPAVQSALQDVTRALSSAGDSVGGLANVRDYIGFLLSGKAGADKAYAKAASRELIRMREAIDAEIASRAPTFPAYLQAYQGASAPINRMEVGRELLDRAGAVPDAITGVRTLTPAQFSRATNDLDTAAAQATGFDKAKAAQILTAEDMAAIRAIQDDLERQMSRANTRPVGSPTQGLQEATKRLATQSALQSLPLGIGKFVGLMDDAADQRVQQRLAYLVANPDQAQRVLAALKPADRNALQSVLAQIATRTSATGGALAPVLVPTLTE